MSALAKKKKKQPRDFLFFFQGGKIILRKQNQHWIVPKYLYISSRAFPTELTADACSAGVGAVVLLVSYKSRKEKPIVFASRTFPKRERNYFFQRKRHYLMDNYISQVLVWGVEGGKSHLSQAPCKDTGPKGQCCFSGSSQDAKMGFDLSSMSI